MIATSLSGAGGGAVLVVGKTLQPPKWIKPQLPRAEDETPASAAERRTDLEAT